ncbi:MAG TPA: PAS domain S-box protein [Blastocatellia bacterium]|nr:PAS domain S-box protein [Blastocatellia bacterium]HMZ19120.1 PAS domain S-box protein [Blastocatellia bacterium]HNG34387.1 PAS domain S-box protein [Blastocatellia bacterium]
MCLQVQDGRQHTCAELEDLVRERTAALQAEIDARKQSEADALFLARLNARIRRDGEAAALMREITQAAGEHLQVQHCLFTENDPLHDRFIVHEDYCHGVPTMAGEYASSTFNSFWDRLGSSGQTMVLRDAARDARTAGFENYRRLGIGAFVSVPLLRDNRMVATMSVTTTAARHWQPREIALLETVAEFTWQLLERLRLEAAAREREQFNQAVLRSLKHHIAILDREGKIVAVNDAWRQFARENDGAEWGEEPGANYLSVCLRAAEAGDRIAAEALAGIQSVLSGGAPQFTLEYPCHSPAEQRWFLMEVTPLQSTQGGAVISHVNITERKRAEETLRRSAETFRLFTEHHPGAVAMFDRQMRYLAVSPRWLRDYKITGDVLGRSHYEVFPEIPERWKEIYRRCLAGATEKNDEDRFERADGLMDWIKWEARPWFDNGIIGGLIIYSEDITARKRAELALLEGKARTAGIINSAMDAIISVNSEQRIVLFNPAAEKMFGYIAAEMMGQPLERLLPANARAAHAEHLRRFELTGATTRAMGALGAISGLRSNGEEFPIEAAISQMDVEGQKLFTVILRDITQRKEAEKQLIEQAALLNHAREAIIVIDFPGNALFWNSGAERLYGWTVEEILGRNVAMEVFREQPEQSEAIRCALMKHGEWMGEFQQRTKQGREITVESHLALVRDDAGEPKSILIINADITEKNKLEQQFFRVQRMESLGALAGGIAHDLNNVLSPIAMGVQMLRAKHPDEFSRKVLDLMEINAERGAAMIKQVLSFARGTGGERVPLYPQLVVKEAVKLMRETFPIEIEIKQEFGDGLWLVEGGSTQLYQILMNLCVNARDAMPHGGTLSIKVENHPIDDLAARMWPEAKAGNYIALTVTDTGEGIPAEHLDRIFDPFFTTKEQGKGTGLGLATVFGIVKAHGGFINVYSEVGRGTEFKIYLPAQETSQLTPVASSKHDTPLGKGELILVVDDEASIREMTCSALETFGYRVLSAGDGAEAVNLYAQQPNEVQLVLTDMMMPLMDGLSMIRTLLHLNPQIKVIVSSGLTEKTKAAEARRLGVERILAKPYNAQTLLKTVAQALDKNE